MLVNNYIMKFLIINDFNDINNAIIRHFSLDKGHYIAKSLSKLGHDIFFMINTTSYILNNIKYINMNDITTELVDQMNYIMIVREPLLIDVLNKIPAIKNKLDVCISQRPNTKFIIKSDPAIWFESKIFANYMKVIYGLSDKKSVREWIITHIDHICAQNELLAQCAYNVGIPKKKIIITGMAIENKIVNYDILVNPYCVNHSYCVNNKAGLVSGKALMPVYYINNEHLLHEFNTKKYIIIYTGRIKTDGGKIFYNMKNIMDILGLEYELHIFPCSFFLPCDANRTKYSSKNSAHLEEMRNSIFSDSKNIIIHYPYEHFDKYKYLSGADCGIDFSQARPSCQTSIMGNAKLLEYCGVGLPTVCEASIQNSYLVKNGKNGIILPPMSSDQDYASAIKNIIASNIDRNYCRKVTMENENWDIRTQALLSQL